MALRNLITGNLPDPAEVEHRSLLEQIIASPLLLPFRIYWNTLNEFRAFWPILLPVLAVVSVRSYRRARKRHLDQLAEQQLHNQYRDLFTKL